MYNKINGNKRYFKYEMIILLGVLLMLFNKSNTTLVLLSDDDHGPSTDPSHNLIILEDKTANSFASYREWARL